MKQRAILMLALLSMPLFAADPQGVVNFHEVNPHIFRGAQPSKEGIQSLAKLGVKIVIDLREPGKRSEDERKTVEATGMHYIPVPLNGYKAPTNEQISKLLGLLKDDSQGPVFIHCRRGADRTGTVIACYRIMHDHWENAKALEEAKGFGMSWTERAMQAYVMHFVNPDKSTIGPSISQ